MKSLVYAVLLAGMVAVLAAGPASASDHLFSLLFGKKGTKNGEFTLPRSIAVGPTGNVYVSDDRDRIQVFSPQGVFVSTWGSPGGGDGQLDDAVDMVSDPTGNLYVADFRNNRVQKFDAGGTFLLKWGSFGNGDGQFNGPIGVAVAPNGNVFVADQDNHRVQYFDGNGGYLGKIGPQVTSGQADLVWPNSVLVDADGNVYVSDSYNRIVKYDGSGTFIRQIGLPGSNPGEIRNPVDLALDPDGNLFVADSRNHRIQEFTLDGVHVKSWGKNPANPASGVGAGEFSLPLDLAFNAQGEFFVADTNNNRVQKFSDIVVPVRPTSWGRIKTQYTD